VNGQPHAHLLPRLSAYVSCVLPATGDNCNEFHEHTYRCEARTGLSIARLLDFEFGKIGRDVYVLGTHHRRSPVSS
jgi:hypothetical protein